MGTITEEELEQLKELEAKHKMKDLSVIEKGEDHESVAQEEENPFQEKEEVLEKDL